MIRLLIKTHFASLRSALSSASNSQRFVARAFEEGEATEEWLDMSGWVVVVRREREVGICEADACFLGTIT